MTDSVKFKFLYVCLAVGDKDIYRFTWQFVISSFGHSALPSFRFPSTVVSHFRLIKCSSFRLTVCPSFRLSVFRSVSVCPSFLFSKLDLGHVCLQTHSSSSCYEFQIIIVNSVCINLYCWNNCLSNDKLWNYNERYIIIRQPLQFVKKLN